MLSAIIADSRKWRRYSSGFWSLLVLTDSCWVEANNRTCTIIQGLGFLIGLKTGFCTDFSQTGDPYASLIKRTAEIYGWGLVARLTLAFASSPSLTLCYSVFLFVCVFLSLTVQRTSWPTCQNIPLCKKNAINTSLASYCGVYYIWDIPGGLCHAYLNCTTHSIKKLSLCIPVFSYRVREFFSRTPTGVCTCRALPNFNSSPPAFSSVEQSFGICLPSYLSTIYFVFTKQYKLPLGRSWMTMCKAFFWCTEKALVY